MAFCLVANTRILVMTCVGDLNRMELPCSYRLIISQREIAKYIRGLCPLPSPPLPWYRHKVVAVDTISCGSDIIFLVFQSSVGLKFGNLWSTRSSNGYRAALALAVLMRGLCMWSFYLNQSHDVSALFLWFPSGEDCPPSPPHFFILECPKIFLICTSYVTNSVHIDSSRNGERKPFRRCY